MEFGARLPLQGDPGYLGDPILVGGPPTRSHLVQPQPAPLVVRKEAQGQIDALTVRLAALEARVAVLEQPWWWTRLATRLQAWARVAWIYIRKE